MQFNVSSLRLSSRESADVSTGLWSCLEIEDEKEEAGYFLGPTSTADARYGKGLK